MRTKAQLTRLYEVLRNSDGSSESVAAITTEFPDLTREVVERMINHAQRRLDVAVFEIFTEIAPDELAEIVAKLAEVGGFAVTTDGDDGNWMLWMSQAAWDHVSIYVPAVN